MGSRIKCVRPIVVKHEGNRATVRCGRCRGCRVRHKMAWTGRLLLESRDHPFSRVVTLTYADQKKQEGELYYKDIQNFLKIHRNNELERGRNTPVRYFVCGEYGEKSGHAHWHMVLFGEKSCQPEWMKEAVFCNLKGWSDTHGFVTCMRLVPASAAYTVGYTLKKGENQSPFMRLSLKPSIAFTRIDQFAQETFKSAGQRVIPNPSWIKVDGKGYPLNDGALKRFQKSYTALGGRLFQKPKWLTDVEAAEYLKSDEYISEKTELRLARDEKERLHGTSQEEEARRRWKGGRDRI